MYSFKQWCIDNNKSNWLDLWDYDLNSKNPEEYSSRTYKTAYFKCKKNIHPSFSKHINNLINSKDCICPNCDSFYQWCIENNSHDLIEAWDDEMDIHTISKRSGKKIKFNVHDVIYYCALSDITYLHKKSPIERYYNSVGYYLINIYGKNVINKYWSDKNNVSPFYIDKGSAKYIWIKCQKKKYHDDYKTQAYRFCGSSQSRCPMCASKIIHPNDSFAQFQINRFGKDWVEQYWCKDNVVDPYAISVYANKPKVHIKCMNVEYHDFWISPNGYSRSNPAPCPYCKRKILHPNDSLAGQMQSILEVWSNKNEIDPYHYAYTSHEEVWFKCENGLHDDYKRRISDYTSKCFRRCPRCVELDTTSSYQKKTEEYLQKLGLTVLHERNCNIIPINPETGYSLPLDNEIPELKLIIEVHGKQHYEMSGWYKYLAEKSGRTIEEEYQYAIWKDNYKQQFVLNQGYYYLAIPYSAYDSNEYKNIIDDKIKIINNQESVSTAGCVW